MNISKLIDTNGYIRIAAFDHRDSLKKYVSEEHFSQFKKLLTDEFSPYITGILVDPFYGSMAIDSAKSNAVSVILSREESGYTDDPEGRETKLTDIDSKKLKEIGATAIKLLLYFNPDAKNCSKQIEILKKVSDEAHSIDLPLLLEPITYPLTGVDYKKNREIHRTLELLSPYADILKIEYPIDVQNQKLEDAVNDLESITQLLGNKPWILLSRGSMPFEMFKSAVQISIRSGAKGYAVGRAVWQELADFSSWDEKSAFIKTTGKDRMRVLSEI